jgi:hypothetical protein
LYSLLKNQFAFEAEKKSDYLFAYWLEERPCLICKPIIHFYSHDSELFKNNIQKSLEKQGFYLSEHFWTGDRYCLRVSDIFVGRR